MRLLSRLSMLAGVVVFVVGMSMRVGLLRGTDGVVVPPPTSSPAVVVAVAPTPAPTTSAIPAATTEPSSTIAPSPPSSPDPAADLVFADGFDVEAAWPSGETGGLSTRYQAGTYVLDAPPSDLPLYVPAVSGEGALPDTVTASAMVSLADAGDGQAGLFVADAHGARVGVLVAPDGRVTLSRDSLESFDVLGTGSVVLRDGPIRVALALGPSGTTALIDGQPVASIREHVVPAGFGLVIWSQATAIRVTVDDYEVRAAPGS
jgi:hypothetical protein